MIASLTKLDVPGLGEKVVGRVRGRYRLRFELKKKARVCKGGREDVLLDVHGGEQAY